MKRPARRSRLDRGLRGWIFNTAKRHYWRVADWYELEDLVQEGYVCYARCQNKYPITLTQPHFCSLVKTSFINQIHDLSKLATRQIDCPITSLQTGAQADLTQIEMIDALLPPCEEEATFGVLLSQLPDELQAMLIALLEDAPYTPLLRVNGALETASAYLWRLIGKRPDGSNLYRVFKTYLS